MMDLYTLQQIFALVFPVAGPLAGVIYTWIVTQKANARKEVEGMGKRLDTVERQLATARTNAEALGTIGSKVEHNDKRITALESELKHLPDKDAVNDLKLAVVDLKGTIKAMDAQLAGLSRTVSNIDGYLRKDDK
jgi:predicted  nucleic acid-binding Zn-ribbon protein